MSATIFNLKKVTLDPKVAEKNHEISLIKPNFQVNVREKKGARENFHMGSFKMTSEKRKLIKHLLSMNPGVMINEKTAESINDIMNDKKTTI